MADWVCRSLGGSLIPRLHLTTLLRRLWLQTNLYCADSGFKRISTAQTLVSNESLLRRLWFQTSLYCTDSGFKRISTAQTLVSNESLLRRLWFQTSLYCTGSGFKRISTAQTLAPNESLLRRLRLQMTSFTQDGSSHTEMYLLHFSIVEGSRDASSIFFTVYGYISILAHDPFHFFISMLFPCA